MADWRTGVLANLKNEERANSFLSAAPVAEPLQKAFNEFGLSPAYPFAWRLLIYAFAEVHFGTHKSAAGRPKKWTGERWCRLLSDFNQIQERNPKVTSKTALCGHLKNDRELKDRYAKVSKDTIRRNLPYARDPARNQILKRLADVYVEDALGVSGTDAPGKREQIKQKAIKKALKDISTGWKRRAKIKA